MGSRSKYFELGPICGFMFCSSNTKPRYYVEKIYGRASHMDEYGFIIRFGSALFSIEYVIRHDVHN